ncbi:MAG: alpha/beta fold hydrolase [Acidobacteriota bacterium]
MNAAAPHSAVHVALDVGAGPTALCLHGNPDTGVLFAPLAARLGKQMRLVAPDLPGFGGSPWPVWFDRRGDGGPTFDDRTLDAMAAWTDCAITQIAPDGPVHLILHDFGGPFGLAWAIRHPERVGRIALLNTFFSPTMRWHFWARVWRTPVLGELAVALATRGFFRLEMRRGSRHLERAHIDAVHARVTRQARRAVLRLYRATDPAIFAPWMADLQRLTADRPTCVLWGMHDPYLTPDLAEAFGATDVAFLRDCGHWSPVEKVDDVAIKLADFFAD